FLDLRERAPGGVYDLFWKKPTGGEVELRIAPTLPDGCDLAAAVPLSTPGATIVRGTLRCPGGIAGRIVAIDGLRTTITDVVVRVTHADGRIESHLLKPDNPAVTIGAAASGWQRSLVYLRLGVEHILRGVDHLLFVLGMLLLVAGRWTLLRALTSFTIAHSVTLAAATLGYASVPSAPLDAAIALSIVFLGAEVVRQRRGGTSFTIRNPWMAAFAFGLLHGFGFASGLTTMGLPAADIPLALLQFNVGVELGQILFVGLIVALGAAFRTLAVTWPRAAAAAPGYIVGTLGAYWTIERAIPLVGGT
ncbi:MAG: HupE/UreJ family protein, partial [Rhodospirillales bacterium]|nr:HupE/UreJ family protein [Rhodospirillales bacterium]